MKDDPIITEIRDIRHKLSEKFGHDPKLLVKFLQEQEKSHADRLVHSRTEPQKNDKVIPEKEYPIKI